MTSAAPPIVRLAERLLVEIEQAVRGFSSRFYKFGAGEELRSCAMKVTLLAGRAWRDRANQAGLVRQLVWEIDELKQRLQLLCMLKAFASFKQFEQLARLAKDLGQQAGGWLRSLHPNAQKPEPSAAPARGQTLSTRAASTFGANP